MINKVLKFLRQNPTSKRGDVMSHTGCCGKTYQRAVKELKSSGEIPEQPRHITNAQERAAKIMELYQKGWRNPQIADRLNVSTSLVRKVIGGAK